MSEILNRFQFRVFDKERKEMSEPFTLGTTHIFFNSNDPLCDPSVPSKLETLRSMLKDTGRFSIMQSTGLADKNGKEIFEGDIVNYLGEGRFKIDIGELGYYDAMDDESGDMDIIPDRLLQRSDNWEIIGNVYEAKKDESNT